MTSNFHKKGMTKTSFNKSLWSKGYLKMKYLKQLYNCYVVLNIAVGLFLGESCTNDDQCSGTEFATQCLYNKTKHDRVCSCINGYVSNGSSCVVGMKSNKNQVCPIKVQHLCYSKIILSKINR